MESKSAQRRARERERLRDSILEAAREILVKDGHGAISIRAVADRIEYSPAALYLHFSDKGEILMELGSQGFRTLTARMKAVQGGDAFQTLLDQGDQYLQFAIQNPHLYTLMFLSEEITLPPERPEDSDAGRCFQVLLDSVHEGRARGVLTIQLPAPVVAYSIWGALHGLATLANSQRFCFLPEEQIPVLFRESARAALLGLKP